MNLVIETDLGHDPDDFFTLAYLLARGTDIRAIVISPGDPDQIAIARFLCDEVGLSIPIGVAKLSQTKLSSGSIHHALLNRYGRSLQGKHDGLGSEILANIIDDNTELLVIGPLSNVGTYLGKTPTPRLVRATMQGGFVPYSTYRPKQDAWLSKFDGKERMPTFNLNGDRIGADRFLAAPFPRQMVGKNVCHTVMLNQQRVDEFTPAINRASELFLEAAKLYFEGHSEKKFHDPIAAVCHLYPEVGVWMDGKAIKIKDGWTTVHGEDKVLIDLDRDAFWNCLQNWK